LHRFEGGRTEPLGTATWLLEMQLGDEMEVWDSKDPHPAISPKVFNPDTLSLDLERRESALLSGQRLF
jgi:hypothetical protein